MANNFRKFGDYYVSKAGLDTNSGTMDSPFLTIVHAFSVAGDSQTIIIGTGTYEEAPTVGRATSILADGVVVFKGNGSNNITMYNCSGIIIQDYAQVFFASFTGSQLTDCNFVNCVIPGGSSGTMVFINCKFVNSSLSGANSAAAQLTSCILVNTPTDAILSRFYNSYANGASVLKTVAGISAAGFDYNNIMGGIVMADGSQAGVELDLATHQSDYPTYNIHSFNEPPLFNNAAKQDFTLQSTSPHIGAGSSGLNIGGTSYAKSLTVVDAITAGATLHQLELFGQDLIISAGFSNGYVIFPPIFIASNPMAIGGIDYQGLLLFDKSVSGGDPTNKYVPDTTVYSGGDASGGGNPDRLVIEIRTSTSSSTPVSDSDYDNNSYAATGAFLKVSINEQPFVDNFGKGSGEPDFDITANQPIVGTYVQPKITLTNVYA